MVDHTQQPADARRPARQRAGRTRVDALVTLNAELGGIAATACDVSETGLKIAVAQLPAPGPITLKLVGLPIFSAEVRWQDAHHIGVRLRNPLPTDCLETWIETHGNRR